MTERNQTERNQKDWRELCAALVNETDPDKFDSLVERLINALDEWTKARTSLDMPHEAIQQSAAMPTCDVPRQVVSGIPLRLDRTDEFSS